MTISVVIPTYNRAHLVGRAIASALAETRPGDEVIVVDDGSTDDTRKAVEKYFHNIRYVKLPNGGAGKARNRGIQEATRDFLAFLDSDDEWIPGTLDLKRRFLQARPDVLFCFSDFIIDVDGERVRNGLRTWHNDPRPWSEMLTSSMRFSDIAPMPSDANDFEVYVGDLYPILLTNLLVSVCTLLVRRKEAGDALSFAEDLPTYEDCVCCGRLARKGLGAFFDCETLINYGHPGPRLTDADTWTSADTRIRVIQRLWGEDQAFLKNHRAAYDDFLRQQRMLRVKGLLIRGRAREAEAEIASLGSVPLSYKVLAALPGSVTERLLNLRRILVTGKWRQSGRR